MAFYLVFQHFSYLLLYHSVAEKSRRFGMPLQTMHEALAYIFGMAELHASLGLREKFSLYVLL